MCSLSLSPGLLIRRTAIAIAAATLPTSVAQAQYGLSIRSASHVDAEIDSIHASLRHDHGAWSLNVRYEIEIEDAHRYDRFDLVLRMVRHGAPLLDHRGRPLKIVVPLRYPSRIDRHEIKFRKSVAIRLPNGAFSHPGNLRMIAEIVRAGDCRVLDRASTTVRFKYVLRPPIRHGRWSVRPRLHRRTKVYPSRVKRYSRLIATSR